MDPIQNTSAPVQAVPQAEMDTMSVQYGGFWIRVLAVIIDGIVIGLVVGALGLVLHVSHDHTYPIQALLAWLYFAFMESSDKQATLGKQILHLKVTDMSGNRLSFAHATGRHFAKIISAIILFIGFLMVGWTAKKQGLHDIIAKTLVVKSR